MWLAENVFQITGTKENPDGTRDGTEVCVDLYDQVRMDKEENKLGLSSAKLRKSFAELIYDQAIELMV